MRVPVAVMAGLPASCYMLTLLYFTLLYTVETDLDVAAMMKDAGVAEQPRLKDAPLVEQVGYRVCILQRKCTDACKHTYCLCQHHHHHR